MPDRSRIESVVRACGPQLRLHEPDMWYCEVEQDFFAPEVGYYQRHRFCPGCGRPVNA